MMIKILKEFWQFLKTQKKWWMLPVIIVLLVVAVIIVFAGAAISNFIYTLF